MNFSNDGNAIGMARASQCIHRQCGVLLATLLPTGMSLLRRHGGWARCKAIACSPSTTSHWTASRDASFISYAGVNVILTLWSPPTKCCEWLHVKSLPVHEMVWCTHARYRTPALIYQTVRRYMVHVTPTTQYNVSHGSVHRHSINQTKCVQPYRTLRCW